MFGFVLVFLKLIILILPYFCMIWIVCSLAGLHMGWSVFTNRGTNMRNTISRRYVVDGKGHYISHFPRTVSVY